MAHCVHHGADGMLGSSQPAGYSMHPGRCGVYCSDWQAAKDEVAQRQCAALGGGLVHLGCAMHTGSLGHGAADG
jgi:hypothetical protein